MNILDIIADLNFYNGVFQVFRNLTMTLPIFILLGMVFGIMYSVHYKDQQLSKACRNAYIPRPIKNDNVLFSQLDDEVKVQMVMMMMEKMRVDREKVANIQGNKASVASVNPFYFFSKSLHAPSGSPQVLVGKGSNYLREVS